MISFSGPAVSSASASLSMTQGPAIRNNGRSEPDLETAQLHAPGRGRQLRGPVVARRPDEAGEQRMAVARRGA